MLSRLKCLDQHSNFLEVNIRTWLNIFVDYRGPVPPYVRRAIVTVVQCLGHLSKHIPYHNLTNMRSVLHMCDNESTYRACVAVLKKHTCSCIPRADVIVHYLDNILVIHSTMNYDFMTCKTCAHVLGDEPLLDTALSRRSMSNDQYTRVANSPISFTNPPDDIVLSWASRHAGRVVVRDSGLSNSKRISSVVIVKEEEGRHDGIGGP